MSVLTLTEARARAAQVLAPVSDTDPPVMVAPVDAVHPPAYVLEWNDPWLAVRDVSGRLFDGLLAVVCLTGRLDPESGVADLEQLIANAVTKFRADATTGWALSSSVPPRQVDYSGVTYLQARLVFRVPVTMNGG